MLLIPVLAAATLLAADSQTPTSPKPPCTPSTQGHVWVERSPSGQPLRTDVCSLDVWRYRWTQTTVHVSQLAKKQKLKDPQTKPR
ncbi:MAG: hypothetical protein JNK48_28935 [Bryobacterales bacterium]|nr:hypothetical protein [Bryobacterales bacterium]